MKTQKSLFFLMAFAFVGTIAFASPADKKAVQKTMTHCIDTYLETLKSGYSADYAAIIADHAKFNLNRNGKLYTHGKSEELKSHGKNSKITQNCELNYNVITASENYALINVSMKYDFFTRENIVSLSKINNSWKITEVNSVFK
jgi:hypothetical protein